jgi:chemosensory pili system protein ChpA (sensor histidine kinase/response regulator)
VDTFDLNTIREAFEADVTRYVELARSAARRCLAAMPSEVARESIATALHAQLAAGRDRGDADWRLLLGAVETTLCHEQLTRRILQHIEQACSVTVRLLAMELAGRRDEALREGAAQAEATGALLTEAREILTTGARNPSQRPATTAVPLAAFDAGALLARLSEQLAVAVTDDGELQEIEHCYHSIRGSSGMVALRNLAECANRIEQLATLGREVAAAETAELQTIATVTARLAAAAAAAAQQARTAPPAVDADAFSSLDFDAPSVARPPEGGSLSALETAMQFGDDLGGKVPPARPEAADFGADLFDSPSLAEPAAVDAADAAPAFDFEPAPAAAGDHAHGAADPLPDPKATPSVEGVDAELLEIFLEEARQCLGDLRRSFGRLAADVTDGTAWLDLSRHFHLLKGSAGTVGVTTLAALAAELEQRAEAYGERKRRATTADLAAIRRDTSAMLAACQLQLDEPAATPEEPTVAEAGLAEVFTEEARGILVEIDAVVARQPANRGFDEQDRAQVAKLLHRLKGSALLQGSEAIGRRAAQLHEGCEDGPMTAAATAALLAGLAELRPLLGLEPAAKASSKQRLETAVSIEVEPVIWEAFEIEAQEFVEQLDRIALELEGAEQPRRRLEDAYRCLHTLKGACNTVGLSPTGAMLHELENYFEFLQRHEVLPPLAGIVRLMLEALDACKHNLKQAKSGKVTDCSGQIRARIEAMRQDPMAAGSEAPGKVRSVAVSKPSRIASESADPEAAGRVMLRVSTERLDRLMDLIGELVVHRSQQRTTVGALNRLQKALKKSRQRLFQTIDRFREQYEWNGLVGKRKGKAKGKSTGHGRPQPAVDGAAGPAGPTGTGPMVPRPTARAGDLGFSELELDHYEDINILARSLEEVDSDIATIQAQIDAEMDGFHAASDGFGALISSLQNEITEARMVPLDQLFLRLRRPIHDAAERLGKDVRVVTTGDDVTLDKSIIDQLYVPLLHLVRNAVAHGIEAGADRRAAGKEIGGTIHLSARQESGQIVLEVRDDGRGLDLAALHRVGVERGLLAPETPVDDPRVRELIFVSGLSTKRTADAVSGRGIGCDVVRRAIEHLSGVIDVVTEAGRGTTFRITMPLTLAIYRALLVRHAGLTFALPISFSERILVADEAELFESSGGQRLRLDGKFLEVRDLSRLLGLPVEAERGRLTVVLRLGPDRIAVTIDEVLGQDEIVVKSLGDVLTGHQMFSGVTVDGEGNLILILDVAGLFSTTERGGLGRRGLEAGNEAVPSREQAAAATSRRARVLYADDSLSVRKAAEKFLGDIGADVVLAVDGMDALDKLRAGAFDMVFTDLEMPRMHGFELLREMRYVPTFKDIPVVVVTSRSGDKHRLQAEKLGCNGYLAKPFTPAALKEQIVRLCGAQAGPQGLVVDRQELAR